MNDEELFGEIKTLKKGLSQFLPDKDLLNCWLKIEEIKFQLPIPKEPLRTIASKVGFVMGAEKMSLIIENLDDFNKAKHIINEFTNEFRRLQK